jgi:Mor family transcriptional regulator
MTTEVRIVLDDIQPVPLTPAQTEDAALELEREFVDILRQEIGADERPATLLAQALVRGLRQRIGGAEIWIPAPSKSERNAAIRREFDGTNLDQVMSRHNVSKATVYRASGRRELVSIATEVLLPLVATDAESLSSPL